MFAVTGEGFGHFPDLLGHRHDLLCAAAGFRCLLLGKDDNLPCSVCDKPGNTDGKPKNQSCAQPEIGGKRDISFGYQGSGNSIEQDRNGTVK